MSVQLSYSKCLDLWKSAFQVEERTFVTLRSPTEVERVIRALTRSPLRGIYKARSREKSLLTGRANHGRIQLAFRNNANDGLTLLTGSTEILTANGTLTEYGIWTRIDLRIQPSKSGLMGSAFNAGITWTILLAVVTFAGGREWFGSIWIVGGIPIVAYALVRHLQKVTQARGQDIVGHFLAMQLHTTEKTGL